tara:strand:+ start:680 stop:1240 length:561 start_codon:yes stop_codon:yes gene_type:complete
MTMTVTKINYSDIDQTIFEECFNKSLPYFDGDKPNIIWDEFNLTVSSSTADKLEAIRTLFKDREGKDDFAIFKLDIDGRIVNYGCGRRELQGNKMFNHELDLYREDAGGSQGWCYTLEYHKVTDEFYRSVSENCAESSVWVVEGSNMEQTYIDCASSGWIEYTNPITIEYHDKGFKYKKLVVTFKG